MKELVLPPNPSKELVFATVGEYLDSLSFKIADVDQTKPWGGAYYIAPESTDRFIEEFFPNVGTEAIYRYGTEVSPKILIVGPHEQLSWQKHFRRAECWMPLLPVGVKVSQTDEEPTEMQVLLTGEFIQHDNEARHRLIGTDKWGVVAEIWQHTVPGEPSDEADIVRLSDFYGRS